MIVFSKNTSGTILQNGLGFTQAQSDMIVPQQLYTAYGDNTTWFQETSSSDGNTYYTMFPLARRAVNSSIYQNFCIEDYLTSDQVRVTSLIGGTQAQPYYLRSGYVNLNDSVSFVSCKGNYSSGRGSSVRGSTGVRPAMVVKFSP